MKELPFGKTPQSDKLDLVNKIFRGMHLCTDMNWFALVPAEDKWSVPELAPKDAFKLDSVIRK